MNDVWPIVHTERAALIDDLEHLDDVDWARASLCEGWSVHDVVAHLVDNAKTTRLGFVVSLARARFDFDRQNARGVARERGSSPAETLGRLRRVALRTSTPPAPLDTRIVEEIVHGVDIRRPLGIAHSYPIHAILRSMQVQATTPAAFGGAKELVQRVRLVPTDADETLGNGPAISGPALSLLLAISGRRTAWADLSGPGLSILTGS